MTEADKLWYRNYMRERRKKDPAFAQLCLERTRRWRARNKKKISAYNKSYKNDNADAISRRSREYWERTNYYQLHAEIIKKRSRKWRAEHLERDKANHLAKRGRKRSQCDGTATRAAIQNLIKSVRSCPYCGLLLTNKNRHLDHKQPLILGGLHSISNITPCCALCNMRKNATPYDQWLLKCQKKEAV